MQTQVHEFLKAAYDTALRQHEQETRSKGKALVKKCPSNDVQKYSRASDVLQLDRETYNPEEAIDSEPTIAVGVEGKDSERSIEYSL